MAVLRALSARTEACSAGQLQWLLQRVLHLLASMRQRGAAGLSPAQLQEASLAAWDAVRAVDSCQVVNICPGWELPCVPYPRGTSVALHGQHLVCLCAGFRCHAPSDTAAGRPP